MKREELIKKWLDDELNPMELKAFNALKDHDDLVTLSDSVKRFTAPEYNSENELQSVLHKIDYSNKSNNNWVKPLIGIAAILTIFFGVRYYNSTLDTEINTLASEKTNIELPDASDATLNALTSLKFNNNRWTNKREVRLEGEAFFKVAKGSKFDVITEDGVVSVLGTQFNVKQRDNIFEVVCYEGLVGVAHGDSYVKLKPGDSYVILDGKLIAKEKETLTAPIWLENISHFESMPFKEVVAEFERQYNVTVASGSIDTTLLFTGNFKHDDMDLALKSITLPLNLKYSLKNDSTIVLSSE